MPSEWSAIINAGSEDRNREFKSSFPWDRRTHGETMAKVTKSILAMSNLRDGGHIVVGVEDDENGRGVPRGVLSEHLMTYSYDLMADFVRQYAEPYARFNLDVVEDSGRSFVVVSIVGFDEVPVICRKSYGDILSEGLVYVRPRSGRPRSERVTSYVDMRELLDLAGEKRLRRYLEILSISQEGADVDRRQFERQLEGFGS